MGNSEVGHLNIGAGRIVQMDITRIDVMVAENTLKDNEQVQASFAYAREKGRSLHLLGLLSDGGVLFFGPVAGLEKSDHPVIREFLEMDRVVRV